jgi:DNA-binding GntR family transcriptional regulator
MDRLAAQPPAFQGVPTALETAVSHRNAAEIFQVLAGLPPVPPPQARSSVPEAQVRAVAIAMRLVEQDGPRELGSEASLCAELDASRSLVRQALRMLQDLDMIQVRIGRGGGYALKPPSPIGIIRQLFSWLAARNCEPYALNALMWDLNAANVRLAGERLRAMSSAERAAHCDRIDDLLARTAGPARFIFLQQSLAEIADCPMVDTLAPRHRLLPGTKLRRLPGSEFCPSLRVLESAIVAALRACDLDRAERMLRTLQDRLDGLLNHDVGALDAAE